MPWWGWLLIGIGALIIGFIVFVVIFGRKMQKKQADAEQQMEAAKQTVSALIIDKQKKKMKESGLPESVLSQAPKYARNMKVPVVKAKVGNRVMTLIADQGVYEILPVKKKPAKRWANMPKSIEHKMVYSMAARTSLIPFSLLVQAVTCFAAAFTEGSALAIA